MDEDLKTVYDAAGGETACFLAPGSRPDCAGCRVPISFPCRVPILAAGRPDCAGCSGDVARFRGDLPPIELIDMAPGERAPEARLAE